MLRREARSCLFAAALWPSIAFAGEVGVPNFCTPLAPAEIADQYAVPPDGAGLPAGHGTVDQGRKVYADLCAGCHGAHLEGTKSIGAPALVGGRGTLASPKPLKTVESYWPYATTLFDYTRRAMPFNAPGSLSSDQVYAVTAYILAEGHVIDASASIDRESLRNIRMPNAAGFFPDPR